MNFMNSGGGSLRSFTLLFINFYGFLKMLEKRMKIFGGFFFYFSIKLSATTYLMLTAIISDFLTGTPSTSYIANIAVRVCLNDDAGKKRGEIKLQTASASATS